MAEAVIVQFLVDHLKQVLIYHAELFSKVKGEVEGLVGDLSAMKSFVEDAAKIQNPSSFVTNLVKSIRVETYKAEDALDSYVVEAAIQKSRNAISKARHPLKIRPIAEEINAVRARFKEIKADKAFSLEALQLKDGAAASNSMERLPPVVEEENVVGFDGEATKVIDLLTRGTDELQVISIVGMGGLGKTTLAKKIYKDKRVTFEFTTRAWTYVSSSFNKKDVLLDILSSLVPNQVTQEMRSSWSNERLVQEVHKNLTWKYLIVVDDVWTAKDWENLKEAFPNKNKGSRILLTSRNKEPASAANEDPRKTHKLKFLDEKESWELLRKKVYGTRGTCLPKFETLGMQIAKDCEGLPLAIIVVAGMLRGKEEIMWENVAKDVNRYIVTEPQGMKDVLNLSYDKLPQHLRACFIYIGVFPEDFEIPVWKLIRLWIAEGCVEKFGNVSLEDKAVENLDELIGRNLVMVSQKSLLGPVKTCRIHDMLRELCLAKAEEEFFYSEIKTPTVSNTYRRLCIQSQISNFIASKPRGEHVRSFLCFNSLEGNIVLSRESITYLPEGFKLLRVFDIVPIRFSIFPTKLMQLVLLRYLAISGNFKILPAPVSNLLNLQTLIVETNERTIDIQADIWKMVHLRHLHTSVASKLSGPPAKTSIGSFGNKSEGPSVSNNNLLTLSEISPDSCTKTVLSRIPNIKKLGIRGELSILMEGKQGSSSVDLAKLEKLEKLKLVNDVSPAAPSTGKLQGLPKSYGYGLPALKKLTLQATYLDWSHMSVLEMLPKLEVLKLKDCAFKGEVWTMPRESRGFVQLQALHIGKTDLVHWVASAQHLPIIQRIVVKNCDTLEAIPLGLAKVSTLQMIELHHASRFAVASAKEIQKNCTNKGLQVDIYPPENIES